jgi:hypothetical protein
MWYCEGVVYLLSVELKRVSDMVRLKGQSDYSALICGSDLVLLVTPPPSK